MKYLLLIPILYLSGCVIPYSVKVPKCSGTVLSAESGMPIESAIVRVDGYPETETRSDEKGNFETSPTSYMQVLSFGDRVDHYYLVAEAKGFESTGKSIMVFRRDQIEIEPITLKRKAEPVERGQ